MTMGDLLQRKSFVLDQSAFAKTKVFERKDIVWGSSNGTFPQVVVGSAFVERGALCSCNTFGKVG